MLHFHFHLNEDVRGKTNEVAKFFLFRKPSCTKKQNMYRFLAFRPGEKVTGQWLTVSLFLSLIVLLSCLNSRRRHEEKEAIDEETASNNYNAETRF